MAKKPCVNCGGTKARNSSRFCRECWYLRQPAEVQLAWSVHRLAAIPVGLRRPRVPERDWPPGRRWCSGCQSFPRIADMPKGGSRCKGCAGAAARDSYVQRTYDISKAEEDAIWEAQGRRCVLCRREVHSKRPAIDHRHSDGEVRGLLCPGDRWCNNAIVGGIEAASQGLPGGALEYAQRLVAYFTESPAQAVLERLRGPR